MQQTPFMIDTGRHPCMGFEPHQPRSKLESVNEFMDRMAKGLEEAKLAITKAKDEYAMYYNCRCEPAPIFAPLQASQPYRVKLGVPSHFDRDGAQGHAFLTSCKLDICLTQLDFIDKQVRIHWALSYFKGGCAASFAERILRQELWSGKMCFASWHNFTEEFMAIFCPENEATTALM
jgi:hypothetical protein